MAVSLIAAVADNGVIGIDNRLPWHLSADLRRFRRLTLGHWLLMGRKTYEGIGRPLPGRETVVLSRRPGFAPAGIHVAHSLAEGLALTGAAAGVPEVFIAGGAEVYRLALELGVADRFWLTRIHRDFAGDACLPAIDPGLWSLAAEERHGPDAETPFAYSFLLYERHRPGADQMAGQIAGHAAAGTAAQASTGTAAADGKPRG